MLCPALMFVVAWLPWLLKVQEYSEWQWQFLSSFEHAAAWIVPLEIPKMAVLWLWELLHARHHLLRAPAMLPAFPAPI